MRYFLCLLFAFVAYKPSRAANPLPPDTYPSTDTQTIFSSKVEKPGFKTCDESLIVDCTDKPLNKKKHEAQNKSGKKVYSAN